MNLTPEEKAKELVDKFFFEMTGKQLSSRLKTMMPANFETAKRCAIITIDLLIGQAEWQEIPHYEEVKQAIEKS